MKTNRLGAFLIVASMILFSGQLFSQGGSHQPVENQEVSSSVSEGHSGSEEKFNASEFIIDHVVDSHEWHILTKSNGEAVAIYLPVIVYSRDKGLSLSHPGNYHMGRNIRAIS